MRDYQPKYKNPYYLEHTVYRRALALVRDYPRLIQAREETIWQAAAAMPGGGRSLPGKPTEAKALRIGVMEDDIRIVERALKKIPKEFRQGVLDNVLFGKRIEDLPGARSTWSRWRGRLLWGVAKGKQWI